MKNIIIWLLVVLLSSHSAVFALALDKEKLMTLKPLCSEKIAAQAAENESNKLWVSLGTGLLGLGLMSANSSGTIDNSKLNGLSIGLVSTIAGALIYFTPGEPVIQNNTLQGLGLTGTDKEEVAYSMLKSNAIRSKENRKIVGIMFAASGLGLALISSMAAGATQSSRDNLNTGAAVLALMGLLTYLMPGASEGEMDQIDKDLGVTATD